MAKTKIKLLDLLERRHVVFSEWARTKTWEEVLAFCSEHSLEAPNKVVWEEVQPKSIHEEYKDFILDRKTPEPIPAEETGEFPMVESESSDVVASLKPTRRIKKFTIPPQKE